MNNRNLFVFGRMGAGKDAAAEYLEEKYAYRSYALADGIRDYIRANDASYVPKSNRALEIDVGEAHRRWFGANYWCRKVYDKARWDAFQDDTGVIIRDGRFTQEYEYFVVQRRFIPVRIVAGPAARQTRIEARDGKIDIDLFWAKSDCEIHDREAYTIVNDGTIGEFHAKIDTLIAAIKDGRAIA